MKVPTLLVIEDTSDHAVLIGFAARRAHPGLDVHTAADGREGICYLGGAPPFHDRRAHPMPDLVILDLLMPGVDGFEVLEWIRARPAPLGVPVVVLTSAMSPQVDARCRGLGADGIFRKPDDPRALGEVVREIVDRWIGRGTIIGAHIWSAG